MNVSLGRQLRPAFSALVGVISGLILQVTLFAQATSSPPHVRPLREVAEAISAGDLKLAETELHQVLNSNPKDFRALHLMGIVRAQQQRSGEAEQFFKQALEIEPEFASGHAALGLLYVQTARREEAIPQLQAAFRLDPMRTDVRDSLVSQLRANAREAVGAENPEKALAALLQARKVSPDDADVEYELGNVALRMSLFADASEAFQRVLARKPDDPDAIYGLGRAQIGAAKYPDAKDSFTRYVRERPNDASGEYALGLALATLQENQGARQHFQQSIVLRPMQTEAYFRLGLLDLDENQLESAQGHFQTVIKRDSKHAGALAGLGRVALLNKNYAEAAKFLQGSIAADPTLREGHYYLGLAYARLGKNTESAQELQTATRLEHEEVEEHQHVLKVLGLEEALPTSTDPRP